MSFSTRSLIATAVAFLGVTDGQAQETYSNCTEFAVGDVVAQYRHWNYDEKKWNEKAQPGMFGTKWRIVDLPKSQKSMPGTYEVMVTVQLIQGEFRYASSPDDAPPKRPGYIERFMSSTRYKQANPQSRLQFCDEFKKIP